MKHCKSTILQTAYVCEFECVGGGEREDGKRKSI